MAGITETNEAISGVVALLRAARAAGHGGYQVEDAGVLVTDEALQQALLTALQGAAQVPTELGDLTLAEGLDLANHVLSELRTLT